MYEMQHLLILETLERTADILDVDISISTIN